VQCQRLAGAHVVGAGADHRDAGVLEVAQGVEQRDRAVVERVTLASVTAWTPSSARR
jgi:hypothetical protein